MRHLTEIFDTQQTYRFKLRNTGKSERIGKLKKLKAAIAAFEAELYTALRADLRKSNFETAVTELFFIYGEIDFAIKNLGSWIRPRRAGKSLSNFFATNRIFYEPKGVCLIIAPWNYPFQLVMSPLISAIAAGNCAIVKPSELSPATSAVISKIIASAFSPEEIACVEGDEKVSTALLELPFDHIFFTGSTHIGKIVMTAAARHLSSVTLELGGKSPVIIDDSADIEKAAKKIAWGKLVNAGQTCIAPDYILIDRRKEAGFISHYQQAVSALFLADGMPNPEVYARIVNENHFARLHALLDDAREKGAVITPVGDAAPEELVINPMLLTGVSKDARIMQEEIFGPLLPVIPFDAVDEAIAHINAGDKPLALYIFTASKAKAKTYIRNTSAGGTCVNDVLVHIGNPKLPFGGTKTSGTGSCHGEFGFKAFSHERAVVFQSKIDATSLIYPPYESKNWVLKLLKKIM